MKTNTAKSVGATPGPWTIQKYVHFCEDRSADRFRIRKDSPDGLASYIAEVAENEEICFEHGGNAIANARLIAAAPELLEMLKEAQVRIFMKDGASELYERIGEILDKAEGREGKRPWTKHA